jgi:hypothetical protein
MRCLAPPFHLLARLLRNANCQPIRRVTSPYLVVCSRPILKRCEEREVTNLFGIDAVLGAGLAIPAVDWAERDTPLPRATIVRSADGLSDDGGFAAIGPAAGVPILEFEHDVDDRPRLSAVTRPAAESSIDPWAAFGILLGELISDAGASVKRMSPTTSLPTTPAGIASGSPLAPFARSNWVRSASVSGSNWVEFVTSSRPGEAVTPAPNQVHSKASPTATAVQSGPMWDADAGQPPLNVGAVGATFALPPVEIPAENEPPVAVFDAVTLNEDESIDIDVLANDPDSDEEGLAIESWEQHGAAVITQNADGTLHFEPAPDFYGDISFSYTIRDAWGLTSSAQVSVTVNPVDDPGVPFNDAYLVQGGPSHWQLNDGSPTWTRGLLYNDIDIDGTAEVDTSSIVLGQSFQGDLDVFPDGTFSYSHYDPQGFLPGTISFQYRLVGSQTYATVTLFLPEFELDPAPGVQGEAYAVGDAAIQPPTGVLANDTDAYLAVVVDHPGGGRLTAFNYDGTFGFQPNSWYPGATPFTYEVYDSTGLCALGTAALYDVHMDIFNGQFGAVVPASQREKVGAFTVANLNDTDGDGTIDVIDNDVTAAPGELATGRRSEVDMMRLVVHKPDDPNPGQNKVTLTVTGGAKLWTTSTKGTAAAAEYAPADLPKVLWVEATQASTALRGITIRAVYRGEPAVVKATGIWVEKTQFINTGNQLPADADDLKFRKQFTAWVAQLGATQVTPHPVNGMVMEFTVKPAGIGLQPGIRFDITRNAEAQVWYTGSGQPELDPASVRDYPSFWDKPNDESTDSSDNDNDPRVLTPLGRPRNSDHIYSIDGPGVSSRRAVGTVVDDYAFRARAQQRANFNEFVRVRLDGGQFSSDVSGSRASIFVPWRSRLDLTKNPNPVLDQNGQPMSVFIPDVGWRAYHRWQRNNAVPGENEIVEGHKAIGNP